MVYLVFLTLVRLFGARILTGVTSADAVVVTMFGAVAGRVIIGHPPTLAAGLIGLVTLVLMEAAFGAVESTFKGRRTFGVPPTVVLAKGRPLPVACRRTHTSEADLRAAIRQSGAAGFDQVECVILESSGRLSVIRRGQEVDAGLLTGVLGAEHVISRGQGGSRQHVRADPDASHQ
ncbi:DUF421 domain-containing protein [Citricoccus sp. GCM10030269]|uniref:DUF421 domain-containing protein n=1 Tax=Citricoccus sp. GCM10030269 TaxID=3273388 RepID=UPI0036165C88